MTNFKTIVVTTFLFAVLTAMGAAAILKGGLYIGRHEGDTMHLMQIVFRMADGQVPHLDFMTPIGALAYCDVGEGWQWHWYVCAVAVSHYDCIVFPAIIWVAAHAAFASD